MLLPSNITSPSVGWYSRNMLRPTVVLPHPDSPTSPTVSPGFILNETPSTAYTFPIPRIGDFIANGHVFLVLCGVEDAANNNGGLRLALGSAQIQIQVAPPPPVATDPPSITAIEVNPDLTVSMEFLGTASITYRLQAATNLTDASWIDVSTNMAATNGTWNVTDAASTNLPVRFYRLVTP